VVVGVGVVVVVGVEVAAEELVFRVQNWKSYHKVEDVSELYSLLSEVVRSSKIEKTLDWEVVSAIGVEL
jgi:hypothetical protein